MIYGPNFVVHSVRTDGVGVGLLFRLHPVLSPDGYSSTDIMKTVLGTYGFHGHMKEMQQLSARPSLRQTKLPFGLQLSVVD